MARRLSLVLILVFVTAVGPSAVAAAPGSWAQRQHLDPEGTGSPDHFGRGLDVSGDRMAVGAPDANFVRIYERDSSGEWIQTDQVSLGGGDLLTRFGAAVSLDGDRLAVGQPEFEDSAVFVFERNPDASWSQVSAITLPGEAITFGQTVELSGSELLVGALDSNTVLAFDETTPGTWALEQRIVGLDDSSFGFQIARQGETMAVSAPFAGANSGGAWVYQQTAGMWTEQSALEPSDGGTLFGYGLDIDADHIVVGALSHGVYVFEGLSGGPLRIESQFLPADPTNPAGFGSSLALAGNRLAVGASGYQNGDVAGAGAVTIFGNSLQGWSEQALLTNLKPGNDLLGDRVFLSSNQLVAGAPGEESGAGAVYVFERGFVGNSAPIADAGEISYIVSETPGGTQVTLDGTDSSDANGDELTYTWTGAFEGRTALGPTPTVTYLEPGVTPVTLTVSDGSLSDTASLNVFVNNVDFPPTADAGPDQTVQLVGGQAVANLDGSGSSDPDPEDDQLDFRWTGSFEGGTAVGVAPQVTFGSAGVFEVTLEVTDTAGLKDSDTVTISVESAARVEISGTIRDVDGLPVPDVWVVLEGDGGQPTQQQASDGAFSFQVDPGEYSISAYADSLYRPTAPVAVTVNDDVSIDLTIHAAPWLSGTSKSSLGAAVPATVTLHDPLTRAQRYSLASDGSYNSTDVLLDEGEYKLKAEHDGTTVWFGGNDFDTAATLAFEDDEEYVVDFVFDLTEPSEPGTITGTITEWDGRTYKYAAGTRLALWKRDAGGRELVADMVLDRETFEFKRVEPGEYQIDVATPDGRDFVYPAALTFLAVGAGEEIRVEIALPDTAGEIRWSVPDYAGDQTPAVDVFDVDLVYFTTAPAGEPLELPPGVFHLLVYASDGSALSDFFPHWYPGGGLFETDKAAGIEVRPHQVTEIVFDVGQELFVDMAGSAFADDIAWMYSTGITTGCGNDRYCPAAPVRRGQMAAFLVRALGLTDVDPAVDFVDDDQSVFEDDVNKLATAGITFGCGADRFCPNGDVSRGQMAAFLVRALGLTDVDPAIDFVDDDLSVFESDINKLATAGITFGCGGNRFCPGASVTRGEMAAFLRRGLAATYIFQAEQSTVGGLLPAGAP